jgi:hypothetical protein
MFIICLYLPLFLKTAEASEFISWSVSILVSVRSLSKERMYAFISSHILLSFILSYLLRGLSLQANYTDRATAVCRRSYCQLLRIEGAT